MKIKERLQRAFMALLILSTAISVIWFGNKLRNSIGRAMDFNAEMNFALHSPYILANKLSDGTYGSFEEVPFPRLQMLAAGGSENYIAILGSPPQVHYFTKANGHLYHATQAMPREQSGALLQAAALKNEQTIGGHYVIPPTEITTRVVGMIICYFTGALLIIVSLGFLSRRIERRIKVNSPSQTPVRT